MKPEKFDEILRRKLEGIQPTYQDDDWGKFRAYQQLHVPTSFWQQFGSTIMYSAAGLVATVLIVTNFYQYSQNQRMDAQVEMLQRQLAQKETALTQTAKAQPDTVYIDRYIAIESPPNRTQTAQNQTNITEPINNFPESNPVQQDETLTNEEIATTEKPTNEPLAHHEEVLKSSTKPTTTQTRTRNRVKASTASNEHLTHAEQPILNINNPKANPSNTKNLVAKSKNPEIANTSQQTKNTRPNFSENNSIPENTIASTSDNQPIRTSLSIPNVPTTLAYEIQPLTAKQTLEELTGLEPAEVKVKRYAYASVMKASREAQTAEAKSPPPSISLKNMKLRAGLGLNIGDRYLGYKVATSVLLGKYWSLDIGLSRTAINGPVFMTEDLLKARTQKDFNTWRKDKDKDPIKPPLAPPIVTNIRTGVNMVRMPLALTYRWSIKDGFTFLLSGGTNINLSAIQKYSYDYRERNGELEQESGSFDVKTAISNDVLIAAGVERQWRNFVVQAEAYTAPYLQKPTSYLSENRNLGVRFKLLYQFGKN